jgi:hypothetical protein
MKKLFLVFSLPACLLAQKNTSEYNYYSTVNELKYTIYSTDYKEKKKLIEEFIAKNHFKITNQNETKNSHHYEFEIVDKYVPKVDSFCNTFGYLSSKNLNSYNNEAKLKETQLELERLELKKKEYEKMLVKIDSVKSNRYYNHWEKTRDIEQEIFQTKKYIEQIKAVRNLYAVEIDLIDEQISPTNNKVNFVHMPGAEYVYLITENPKAGLSYATYQGYCLKYLFTRGKSYATIGALKAIKPADPELRDTTASDELFMFTFGQDWYSRYLGRGNNKFFNLYIGYQAGMFIADNGHSRRTMGFLSPGTGIELFKNKYLLFDVNANYFLPLNEDNRYLRGYRLGGSINFTF